MYPLDSPAIGMSMNERTYALGEYEEAKQRYKGAMAQFSGLAQELHRKIPVPSARVRTYALPFLDPDGADALVTRLRELHVELQTLKAQIESLASEWKFEPFIFGPQP